MAVYGYKPMNWYSPPSAYAANEAWRSRRKAMVDDFMNASTTASSAFGAAWSNQISGLGELAAKAAIARAQAAIKAAIDKSV